MRVPHSLFVDDCADAVYVADRDNGAVHRIQIRGDEAGGAPTDHHDPSLNPESRRKCKPDSDPDSLSDKLSSTACAAT